MQPNLVSRSERPTGASQPSVFPYGRADSSTPHTDASQWPETPGADDCPDCGTSAVQVQGLLDCPDCDWAGSFDGR